MTVLLAVLLTGCVTLHPWERERLISPVMQDTEAFLEASFDEHVFTTRESMLGASDAGGASCGCD